MNLSRIDHTAVAVKDLDEALERYRGLLGDVPVSRTRVDDQRVEVAFLRLGDTQLELVQPTSAGSGIARFLEKRGEGLHHIGIAVENIGAELRRLEAQGVRLIDREPRRGVHGQIAFVHPEGTGGVLVELVAYDPTVARAEH